jgi:hypothetical protein
MIRAASCSFFLLVALASVAAACGSSPIVPQGAPRESGQSRLIEKSFAGKNRCNPQDHARPFVVEWDGTDISSFESRATTDVVFVRYEECELHVLDGCTNDAVRGSLGAYGAVDWTSGSVEKVDILNEDELYAKLPLGATVLGARVQGGERFHMEYFVSGTRNATRPAVYRGELAQRRRRRRSASRSTRSRSAPPPRPRRRRTTAVPTSTTPSRDASRTARTTAPVRRRRSAARSTAAPSY